MAKVTSVYDSGLDCIINTVEGVIKKPTTIELVENTAQLSEKHNCLRCLNDIRKAENKLSALEIFHLPSQAIKGNFDRRWRRAILVDEFFDEVLFYEDTATNQGLQVKVFEDLEEALSWLNEDAE